MRHPVRFRLLALAGVLLVSGCALKDPRDSYAYGRVADGLWDADYDLLLDWNFPTSANQGRLEAPQRFRPERPAIGVPWATDKNTPLPPPPEKGASAAGVTGAHDVLAARKAEAAPAAAPAAARVARVARADEPRVVR